MCEKRRETTFYKARQENRNGRCNAAFLKPIQDSAVTYRYSVGELRRSTQFDDALRFFVGSAMPRYTCHKHYKTMCQR